MVAPDRDLSMRQIELFDHFKLYANFVDLCKIELFEIGLFDHLTGCKEMTDV